ncbi:dienelactone hydrolase [Aspergillus arachidicola]|uniref:Dienelactone hydrolase n=1 Tax=Aspergillus arachidicola TaxID=656916 RepID=A0A2G7FXX1_9EURO|nr:dienelactone hydrolase [Aspergillus arachidicola]
MERLRQHIHRRRRSSTPSRAPPQGSQSPSLSSDRRKKSNSVLRRLYVTSDTADFDANILRRFEAEGFSVEYIPFQGSSGDFERDRKDLDNLIHEREDDLEPGERYAIVAYNKPAYLLLTSHHHPTTATNPFPLLCALVTYYPQISGTDSHSSLTDCPNTTTNPCIVPPSTTSSSTATCYDTLSILPIQVHLAGHQPTTLWDDYNSHPSKKRHRCHLFFYPESEPGFAESTARTHDVISSRLAWSRALECLKRGFGWPGGSWNVPAVETVWEEYWRNLSYNGQEAGRDEVEHHAANTVNMMVGSGGGLPLTGGGDSDGENSDPTAELNEVAVVNCVPTLIGGEHPAQITNFYTSQFFPAGPPSQSIRLLSRTIGIDRIVDELLLTFTHTEEIPWLLPRVPPTGKQVRVVIIMTASFIAGRLARHNIYWDQASVLVQIGLLDPSLVPSGFKATGKNREGRDVVESLPVVGGEGVNRALF